MRKALAGLLDFVFWAAAVFYTWGGYHTGDRSRLTYPSDVLTAAAIVYALLRTLAGIRMRDTSFGRAWNALFAATLEALRLRSPRPLGRLSWPSRLLGLAAVYVLGLFVTLPILNHFGFGTHAFDFGVYNNAVYNGSRTGSFFTYFLIRGSEPTRFFPNNRLDFGLLLFAPLYRLWAWSGWLLLAQSAAFLAALVPLYKLGELLLPRQIPRWMPLVAYWLFDPVHRMNLSDWHETPFVIPFALWAFYWLERGRLGRAFVFLGLMAMWRDDLWLAFAGMSFYFALRTRRWRICVPAALLALCIPPLHLHFFNTVHTVGERYPYLGPDMSSALRTIATRPWVFLIVAWENREFFRHLLLESGGGLFLFGGSSLVALIPPLAEVSLAKWGGMLDWNEHYIAIFAPMLFYCTLLGWKRAYPWLESRYGEVRASACLGLSLALSMNQLGFSETGAFTKYRADLPQQRCLRSLTELVPADAPILATDPFAAALSNREFISLPFAWIHLTPQDWAKVDQSRAEWLLGDSPADMAAGGPWELVRQDCGGRYVARKRPAQ